jgi:alpha-tubulin suppressor-like RCC1 family protein
MILAVLTPLFGIEGGAKATSESAVAVSAGQFHTCAATTGGAVRCWGRNDRGQLGYGHTDAIGDDETPASVGPVDLGSGRRAVALSAGRFDVCAILDDGSVICWGANTSGSLGYGNAIRIGDDETPAAVGPVDLGPGRKALAISGSFDHRCAILDDGSVRCWGNGLNGKLGYGNTAHVGDNETPGSVGPVDLGVGRTAVAISADQNHSCAVLDNGSVRCWGRSGPQLGYGNLTTIGDNETPGSVGPVDLGPGAHAVGIATGVDHTCAILDDGSVRCWGRGSSGQLGYGNLNTVGDDETPATVGPVDLGSGRTAIAIDAGHGAHTCALLDDASVRCWGHANFAVLGYGNGDMIGDNETPGSVGPLDLGVGKTAVAISAGGLHNCAILDDGKIRCWGYGGEGQLGYADTNDIGDNETPGSAGPVDLGEAAEPAAIIASDPASPANENFPKLRGTVPPGTDSVIIYNDATCSDEAAGGQVSVEEFTTTGGRSAVAVPDNSTTTFAVRTFEFLSGATGPCSEAFTYVEDSQAHITASDPNSPANNNAPRLIGTVPSGTESVIVYNDEVCSDEMIGGRIPADEFTTRGGQSVVPVPDNSMTTFAVRAYQSSTDSTGPCSEGFAYVEDSQANITASDPASPANDNSPRLIGTVPPGTDSVNIYNDAACADEAAGGRISAEEFTTTGGRSAVPVADNSTTTFSVRSYQSATDSAGPCSEGLTYIEESGLPEICDGADNDGDGATDEGFTNTDADDDADCVDTDDDDDGQSDADESACGSDPLDAASLSPDADGNGGPDCGDFDDDNDGVLDGPDNCDLVANADQADTDGDATGDACDATTYRFTGFFAPVDNRPTVNTANAGRTIPMKYRLVELEGTPVSSPSSFVSFSSAKVNCGTLETEGADSIETYTGNSGLKYQGDGNWHFNWATSKSYASSSQGPCRVLTLKLADGSTHNTSFKFK